MKKTPQNEAIINNVINLGTPATNAMRLLEKLKSPFLFLASELLSPNSKPHNPVSQQSRLSAMGVESLSGGRLALNDNSGTGIENQESTQHRKHPTDSMGNCFKLDTLPSRWFQKRKRAAKEIRDLSNGQLVLSQNQLYYYGDNRSHQVTHIKCGCTLKLALSELRLEGPNICPICHGGQLGRLNHDQIFDYICGLTKGRILFIKNQLLGHSNDFHVFYDVGRREPFSATVNDVVNNKY